MTVNFRDEFFDLTCRPLDNLINVGENIDPSDLIYLQSSVKSFLPGFGNGWLKYCTVVQFWGGQRNILSVILKT